MKKLPDENEIINLADLYKMFGDTSRLKIMMTLLEEEKSVGEIVEAVDMTQSAVSHQLGILRKAKLVRTRREGKQIFYAPDDEHIETIILFGLEHIRE